MANVFFEIGKNVISTEIGMKVMNVTKDQVIKHAPELTTKAAERTAKVVSYAAGITTGTVAGVVSDITIERGKDIVITATNKIKTKANNKKVKKLIKK